jgi:hypothetical protein
MPIDDHALPVAQMISDAITVTHADSDARLIALWLRAAAELEEVA